jgi:hypothetical protein
MTENLTWIPVATKPEPLEDVLCLHRSGRWFQGFWDDKAGTFETGGWFDWKKDKLHYRGVTHWAHVQGPQ